MDNRKRNNQLKIYLTDEEKEVFEKKMKLANCKTMLDISTLVDSQWMRCDATE